MNNNEIIAYELNEFSSQFTPIPARLSRKWMGKTFGGFVKRCVPLGIANQCGWIIPNPVSFMATWNGGSIKDAIVINFESEPQKHYAVSHFGYGILTIQIPLLLRTPPEVDLWVRGAPNEVIDGVTPLEGIVETDWLPQIFTMNWKFTRFPVEVKFKAGFPLCFITPFPRAYPSGFSPRVDSIDSNPELKGEYELFRGSREEFLNSSLRRAPIQGPVPFQGHYIRGESPGVSRAPKSHRCVERLKHFKR